MNKETTLVCSRCGKREKVSLDPDSKNSILKVGKRWGCTGVLYCPDCIKVMTVGTTNYETVLSVILRYMR